MTHVSCLQIKSKIFLGITELLGVLFCSRRRQFSSELANAEKEEKKIRGEEWAKRQVII